MSRVRIVGGQWRSRRVDVADALGLRPTPDRVRETLFNWLGQRLDGMRCLDLFAGSGVLGFEAASRGACEVVMVEYQPAVVRALQATQKTLKANQVTLIRSDALDFAARCSMPFDVVFIDPPYRNDYINRLRPHLASLTHDQSRLYIECESPLSDFEGWQRVRAGTSGQVHFHLFQPSEPST